MVSIFPHLKQSLSPWEIIFGATVLGKGATHDVGDRISMNTYSKEGKFGGSWNHAAATSTEAVKVNFDNVDAKVKIAVLLSAATRPE